VLQNGGKHRILLQLGECQGRHKVGVPGGSSLGGQVAHERASCMRLRRLGVSEKE
jgi:hypothetical protein